jgi:hypothetical protein
MELNMDENGIRRRRRKPTKSVAIREEGYN